jgi:HK97 family phage major capsid protein
MADETKVVEQLNKTVEQLREFQKRADDERETRGAELAETRAQVEKITADVVDLDKTLVELRKTISAPRSEGADGKILTPEQEMRKRAFDQYARRGFTEDMPKELRASLSQASDAEGGFFAPPDYETGFTMNAYNEAFIRPLCDVGTTGRGQVIGSLMSKPSVAWGTELLEVSAQDLAAGALTMNIMKLQALFTVSNDTLDDAHSNIQTELANAVGPAIAEAEDTAFAAGASENTPGGIIVNATVQSQYVASGVADALFDADANGIDALIRCFAGLKSRYRRNSTWAFNSTTMGVIMLLKDGTGRYYWQPATANGTPSTLLGRPYVTAEGMPDIAAGTYPIVLGDFRQGYKIRDRSGMSIQRLSEKYATYDQTGFIVKKRVGGQVKLPEAFKPVKIAAS